MKTKTKTPDIAWTTRLVTIESRGEAYIDIENASGDTLVTHRLTKEDLVALIGVASRVLSND